MDVQNGAPVKLPILFPFGDKLIDGAVVKPLSFKTFSECIADAQGMKAPRTFEARLRRLRLSRQVSYYMNGTTIAVTPDDVVQLPIPAARLLTGKLDDEEGKAGKIIRTGDGIDKAITFELGTPISTGQGKPPITELEFLAKVYGDIEDVMSMPDSIQQAMMLIETLAKPLPGNMQLLPSMMLPSITVADGVAIARDVLPLFLGSPDE